MQNNSCWPLLQLNLHKRQEANLEVVNWLKENKNGIVLGQEPSQQKGRISHFNNCKNLDVFVGSMQTPRAFIALNKTYKALLQIEFCDPDMTTISIENNGKLIYICSLYMPYEARDIPSQTAKNLINFCEQSNLDLLIGTDANSHNVIWGSTDTNSRGETLLEYIVSTNLVICNRGDTPTFGNILREEVIDLTLCNIELYEKIKNWKVLGIDMQSDHWPIVFEMDLRPPPEPEPYRNIKKADWSLYTYKLAELTADFDNLNELNGLVEQLNNAIIESFEYCCPLIQENNKVKKIPWWNEQLTRLKRISKQAKENWREERSEENRALKNEAKHGYKKAIQKARNEHWKTFCENMENISLVARMHKVMKNGKMTKIGTLKKADGQFTANESETLRELFDCLLPPSVALGNQSDLSLRNNVNINDAKLIEIINHETVCAAVNGFDPYKSPGFDGIYPIMLQKGIQLLSPHLIKIYKISLKTGKLADCWLQVKTVFIPKPGKSNYINAKSYRPISLMSFVMKTLERLVYWHLQNDHWHKVPINNRVYSYMEGVSTETALHEVTQKIENCSRK